MSNNDGMNYAPKGKPNRVVEPGQFVFAATSLDHGHIYGMCNGLVEAGAVVKWVYDADSAKVDDFINRHPGTKAAESLEQILEDAEVQLVAAAAIPSLRGPLGVRVMRSGKHYFTDKTPFTTLEQLEEARAAYAETGKKYAVYYSERLHVESAIFAGQLIQEGAIGRVVQVMGWGPHRLNAPSRPAWFFEHEKYGGILCDIGSHQLEQFLYFTGNSEAKITSSKVANYANKQYPELEDFGDITVVGENGATGYFRVDWLTPDGLATWGDGRTIIMGTEGYIELRKYIDVGRDNEGDQLYLVNAEGTKHMSLKGKVGYPFFGELILDCLNGTENAMTQEHAFKAAELCLVAQRDAVQIEG
ncbi:Gfo/Idh/MocA family oxidoreductase [Paenibacillus sp. HB172176]|uniref:Gfo/Idh/MocA family protein n=1 Tax=Paenibacillus sp. HB172176 TaxID=2493690 RepID=UPI001438D4E9|nr:Gfo/Idh/MocA family oxidoreductase [Paenibacillus sp. HB172176]